MKITSIAAKSVRPSFISVSEVRPGRIRLAKENNLITIIGSNFGRPPRTVWIESYPPVSEAEKLEHFAKVLSEKEKSKMNDEDIEEYEEEWKNEFMFRSSRLEEQFDVTPTTQTSPTKTPWEDNRIVVSLDSIKDKLKAQKYVVRVEKDGILTYATTDAIFEITFPMVVEVKSKDTPTNNSN
ncbi:MAG TPA: hypothetical protein VLA48_09860 [Nitrososphaeraceae archaeon]|nr:hypothetical protein [Nitrososphaeraceae archaeon]